MGARNAPPHPAELGQGGGPEGATPGSLSPESLPDEKVAEGAGVPFLQVWAGHQAILGEESARGEGQVARSAEGRGGQGPAAGGAGERGCEGHGRSLGCARGLTRPSRPARSSARGDAAAQGARPPAARRALGRPQASAAALPTRSCPRPVLWWQRQGRAEPAGGGVGAAWVHTDPRSVWRGRPGEAAVSSACAATARDCGEGPRATQAGAWPRGLRTRCTCTGRHWPRLPHPGLLVPATLLQGRSSNACAQSRTEGPAFRSETPPRARAGRCRRVQRRSEGGTYRESRPARAAACPPPAALSRRLRLAGSCSAHS